MNYEESARRIGKITGESGKIIANTSKSIHTRINSVERSINALKEIGIDAEGKSSSQVLEELDSVWKSLDKQTQQDLGIKIAGRYNFSRFIAMMG
ncbi:hypothetical protein [Oceanobacillus sp. FSL H7-0719]|uniref:hypothetical protein n=1 Tax=Oceanobacillus sp. FSL H7-0719 TaxID=2954507 RepID=UPI0032430E09